MQGEQLPPCGLCADLAHRHAHVDAEKLAERVARAFPQQRRKPDRQSANRRKEGVNLVGENGLTDYGMPIMVSLLHRIFPFEARETRKV